MFVIDLHIIRLHRMHSLHKTRAIATDVARSVVCLCLCVC